MASYYVYSGAGGSANGTSWANAYTALATALSGKVAGDIFYVAHDHAEATASPTLAAVGTIASPAKVICVNRAGSVPPVSADRRTTATVSSTTNTNLTLTGTAHYDGIIFTAGAGTTSSANVIVGSNNAWHRFDNCSLRLGIVNSGISGIFFGGSAGSSTGSYAELNNTTMSFAGVNNTLTVCCIFKWRNTLSALLGTIPTILFVPGSSVEGFNIECIGVDFSAAGSGKTLVESVSASIQNAIWRFLDCKLNASVTKNTVPTGYSAEVDFIRSGASGVNYAIFRHRVSGTLDHETTIVRTGGASDGTTTIAWKIVTTANCAYSLPFECPPIAIWNDTTGSAVTATVEGIWGGGAVPNDDDVWVDVEYLGDASSPQGSFVNDGKIDLLTTAAGQTSSSETWGGSTTKFKLAVTFTAQQKGWIYARVKCAKASSTFYIDPLITLT